MGSCSSNAWQLVICGRHTCDWFVVGPCMLPVPVHIQIRVSFLNRNAGDMLHPVLCPCYCSPTAAAPQLKQLLVSEQWPFFVFLCIAGLSCVLSTVSEMYLNSLPVLTVLQQALISSARQTFTQSPKGFRLCHQLSSLSLSSVLSFFCLSQGYLPEDLKSFTSLPLRHFQVLGY